MKLTKLDKKYLFYSQNYHNKNLFIQILTATQQMFFNRNFYILNINDILWKHHFAFSKSLIIQLLSLMHISITYSNI